MFYTLLVQKGSFGSGTTQLPLLVVGVYWKSTNPSIEQDHSLAPRKFGLVQSLCLVPAYCKRMVQLDKPSAPLLYSGLVSYTNLILRIMSLTMAKENNDQKLSLFPGLCRFVTCSVEKQGWCFLSPLHHSYCYCTCRRSDSSGTR